MKEAKAACKEEKNGYVGFVIDGEDEVKDGKINIRFKKKNSDGSVVEFHAYKRGEGEMKWISFTMDQPADHHFYLEGAHDAEALCNISDAVIFLGGGELEARAISLHSKKAITVAATGGAAAGYFKSGAQKGAATVLQRELESIHVAHAESKELCKSLCECVERVLYPKEDCFWKKGGACPWNQPRKLSERTAAQADAAAASQQNRPLLDVKIFERHDLLDQRQSNEEQYHVILNSISPEWRCATEESGKHNGAAHIPFAYFTHIPFTHFTQASTRLLL
jgi:hypothetical protein